MNEDRNLPMTRLHFKKISTALAIGVALLLGSLGVVPSASGDAGAQTAADWASAGSNERAASRQLRTTTRPVSQSLARSNARKAALAFFEKKGPYINRGVPELETAWNERGTAECQKLGGGIRIRCVAWVGLAAELTDEEVPYKTCDWWVETLRLQSGRVVVRDRVAQRRCETLWF